MNFFRSESDPALLPFFESSSKPLKRLDADCLIAGEWVVGDAGTRENVDPGTGRVIGRVSLAAPRQVAAAIDAADDAFESWAGRSAAARGNILLRASGLLEERAEEAVATLVLEAGKTEADARGEV